jgi:hypothetical protein
MQVNTDSGIVFTKQQTRKPYSDDLALFNLKEANSMGNCFGGGCGGSFEHFTNDVRGESQEASQEASLESLTDFEDANAIGTLLNNGSSPFIAADDRYIDPTNADVVHNATLDDYTYNSYADWRAPSFNQWTRIHDDSCNEENRLRIGSKPMKYYVNQYNSPQVDPFQEYSIVGNQKQFNVRNEFERAIPTRLNPIYPVSVEPYATTPFLGANNPNRIYADTSDALRWSREIAVRPLKSEVDLSSRDFGRWDYVDASTVQNAGQFTGGQMNSVGRDGYYKYTGQNHIIFGNGAVNYTGISTRNLTRNAVDLMGC